jgi:hypothetical protein
MLIKLTHGYFTEIDDEDGDLADIKWYASMDTMTQARNKIYATVCRCNKTTRLHRVILERMLGRSLENKEECDHIDGDTLNNKRANLRLATHKQNLRNRIKQSKENKFKGVYFERFTGKWKAQIMLDGKNYNLGRYSSEIDAAKVYDLAAITYFGDFALTNGLDADGVILPKLKRPKKSKSGFKGVYKHGNRWQASIRRNGKIINIGSYLDPEEAHLAYEAKVRELQDK